LENKSNELEWGASGLQENQRCKIIDKLEFRPFAGLALSLLLYCEKI
jgi:hypothetical protein